jgi:hypothetical protein
MNAGKSNIADEREMMQAAHDGAFDERIATCFGHYQYFLICLYLWFNSSPPS